MLVARPCQRVPKLKKHQITIMNRLAKQLLLCLRELPLLIETRFDKLFLASDVPITNLVSHQRWQKYLYEIGNKPGWRVLEIGSREVTGFSNSRQEFAIAECIGFDYYPGDNVDIVGDFHNLSSYFKTGEQFDIIYSSACFEHFAMHWIVAVEISKLLRVGGIVFVETHFSFSSHERPWHFFQFSDMALRAPRKILLLHGRTL